MKKLLALLTACSLVLTLAACGAKAEPSDTGSADEPAEETLQIVLGAPLTFEADTYADDGTLLLSEKYELPQLALQTADGSLVSDASAQTNGAGNAQSAEAAVCGAFNAEMQRVLTAAHAESAEIAQEARDYYNSLDDESRSNFFGPWASEMSTVNTYQTGGLLSVTAEAYTYYGGAHPNTATRTWNFDLHSGEFLTLDLLDAQATGSGDGGSSQARTSTDSALGRTLISVLSYSVLDQIREQNLSEGYFEDYESYVNDLSTNADFYFDAEGINLVFDVYVIAPYAAGPQTFHIPYSTFYNALSPRTQSLLDVPQDEIVLADYYTTQTLWSWFYMTTAPLDTDGAPAAEEGFLTYYRCAIGGVTTMDALRELLCEHVSGEVADEWLAEEPVRFAEYDGVLCSYQADRGSDLTIGGTDYKVTFNGDGGELTQTVSRQDWDADGNIYLTGETDEYVYPFTLVDGHAVFSAFPCPL